MSDSGNRRDIELRIRAQDLSTADFKAAAAAVNELASAVQGEIDQAKKGAISLAELRESVIKLEQAGKSLTSIAGLIDRFKQLDGVLTANAENVTKAAETLVAYRASLDSTGNTSKSAETKLASLVRQLEQAEAAFNRNRSAMTQTGEALNKAGIDTNNLAEAERNLKAVADSIGPSMTALNEAQLAYARNIRLSKVEQADFREKQKQTLLQQQQEKANWDAMTASAKKFNEEQKILKAQRDADQRASYQSVVSGVRANLVAPAAGTAAATAAIGAAGARGASAGQVLFGLRPYELQNLSYQINDIISGLAMGQRPMQILAQQGGQVLQIFQRNLFDLLKYLPLIATGAAAATVAISALMAAFRSESAIREFNASLAVNTEGYRLNGQQLNVLRKQVQDFGITSADAIAVIKQLAREGLPIESFKGLIQLAKDIADVTGKTVPASMTLLIDSFKGGFDSVTKLDKELDGPFSAAQLQGIREALAFGDSQQRINLILEALTTKYRDAAANALGPFGKATRDVTNEWHHFIDGLSEGTAIQGTVNALNHLAEAIKLIGDTVAKYPKLGDLIAILAGAGTGALVGRLGGPYGALAGAVVGGGATALGIALPPSEATVAKSGVEQLQQKLSLTVDQAAGILGALKAESNLRPDAFNPTGGGAGAYGIAQARGDRQPAYRAAGDDFNAQLDVVIQELLSDKFASVLAEVKAHPGDAAAVARIIESNFEIPGKGGSAVLEAMVASAQKHAADILKTAGGGASSGTTAPTGSSGTRINIGAPPPSGVTQQDIEKAQEYNKTIQDGLDAQNTANRQIVLDLTRRQAIEEATKAGVVGTAAEVQGEAAAERKRAEFAEIDRKNAQEDQDRFIKDQRHGLEIRQAGLKAAKDEYDIEAAQNEGRANFDKVRAAQLRGEQEARDRFTKADQANEAARQADLIVSRAKQENDLKYASNYTAALAGINEKFDQRLSQLKKEAETNPAAAARVEIDKQLLEVERQRAIEATKISAYEAQGKEALATRNALVATYTKLQDAGDISLAEKTRLIKEAYATVAPEINDATAALQKLIDTNKSLTPDQVLHLKAVIMELRSEVKYVDPDFKALKKTIEDSFSTNLSTAFDTIGQALGGLIAKTKTWKDVWISLETAVANFFAALLKDIATTIIKQEALKLLGSSSGGSISGGIASLFFGSGSTATAAAGATTSTAGTGISLLTGASLFHGGGVVGRSSAPMRAVDRSWFTNAPRYHTGTIIGLSPDEQAAVLRKGEEVLTQDNPRNVLNAARQASSGPPGPLSIRNVLVMDESQIPAAMAGAHGEKVTMSHIVRNAATVRQIIRG